MQALLWQFLAIPTLGLVLKAAAAPLDIPAPSTAGLGQLALVVLVLLCGIVIVIALAAFFIIRAIKRHRSHQQQP